MFIKDAKFSIVAIFCIMILSACSNKDKFVEYETIHQPCGEFSAVSGYYNSDALSGYDELYLVAKKGSIDEGKLILRLRGDVDLVEWKGCDTISVISSGYMRKIHNRDGFPVVLKINHTEEKL